MKKPKITFNKAERLNIDGTKTDVTKTHIKNGKIKFPKIAEQALNVKP